MGKKMLANIGKVIKIVFCILGAILLCAILLRIGYREFIRGRHKIKEPGIDRMESVEIGGIDQTIYIRGEDKENPVILFLHGGPGSPMIPSIHGFQYDWEKDFTVVQWDQRFAGKTYYANDPEEVAKTLSYDRMVEDAWEVSQYIKSKLGKEKIILMGHSWGTMLGTALVQTHPEAFSAYIAVGQVVDFYNGESMGFEAALNAAKEAGNKKDVEALEQLRPYPMKEYNHAYMDKLTIVRNYQAKYNLAVAADLKTLIPAFTSPYYNVKEIMFYTKDLVTEMEPVFKYMVEEYDSYSYGINYQIPVFYLMGENDYQTPEPLAAELFQEINAPLKRYYKIENAGHFTMMENKAEFTRILLDEIRPLF